jgi:hypothetical protein
MCHQVKVYISSSAPLLSHKSPATTITAPFNGHATGPAQLSLDSSPDGSNLVSIDNPSRASDSLSDTSEASILPDNQGHASGAPVKTLTTKEVPQKLNFTIDKTLSSSESLFTPAASRSFCSLNLPDSTSASSTSESDALESPHNSVSSLGLIFTGSESNSTSEPESREIAAQPSVPASDPEHASKHGPEPTISSDFSVQGSCSPSDGSSMGVSGDDAASSTPDAGVAHDEADSSESSAADRLEERAPLTSHFLPNDGVGEEAEREKMKVDTEDEDEEILHGVSPSYIDSLY